MTSPPHTDLELDFHIVGETGFCFSSDSSVAVAAPTDVVLDFASRYHRGEPLTTDSPLLGALSESARSRMQAAFHAPRCHSRSSDGYTEAKRILRGLMTIESARKGALQSDSSPPSFDEPVALEHFAPHHAFDRVVRNRVSSWGPHGIKDARSFHELLFSALAKHNGRYPYASAGAIYGLRPYILAKESSVVPEGIYSYHAENHSLSRYCGDVNVARVWDALSLEAQQAKLLILLCQNTEAHVRKYGYKGFAFSLMEVGSAIHSMYLAAARLGISCCALGQTACSEEVLSRVVESPESEMQVAFVALGLESSGDADVPSDAR
jgi:SagB-type dehydrogenase family enzyme